MTRLLLLLLLLMAGCTLDLPVGTAPTAPASALDASSSGDDAGEEPDAGAPPDAGARDAAPPDAGADPARTLQVVEWPSIMCADSLGGREADFAALRARDVNLSGGGVDFRREVTSVILNGAPLEAAFQTSQLVLRDDVVPDQPPGTYLAAVPISGGPSGPAGTQLQIAAIYVDTTATPMGGEAGFQFETPNADGACFLSFSITLLAP